MINDIATLNNIHPPNKQDVGHRLAQMALARTYGVDGIVDTGPRFVGFEVKESQLHVRFKNTADGLRWRVDQPGTHFEIAGPGSGWHTAKARIKDDVVVLSHPSVPTPTTVRFAWHTLAEPTLVNGAGLPTGAFRAGSIPRPDALAEVMQSAAAAGADCEDDDMHEKLIFEHSRPGRSAEAQYPLGEATPAIPAISTAPVSPRSPRCPRCPRCLL